MPKEPWPPFAKRLPTPGHPDTVHLGSSCAHPLVFGSWRPEDFDTLASEISRSSAMPTVSDAHTIIISDLNSELMPGYSAPSEDMNMPGVLQHAPTQPAPASAPVCNELHILMDPHAQLLQHQLLPVLAQPIFLVPAGLPFAPQLLQVFGGMVAASPATFSAWGMPNAANVITAPPLSEAFYSCGPGFWLHGMYFPSHEHFVAYRRRAIAYNFHYFGIRPFFRPPPDLPRPRPPNCAKPRSVAAANLGGITEAAVGAGSSTAEGNAPIPRSSAAMKPGEDCFESPCGSPSSSSTCSNGDSDDASSDVSHPDPESEVFETQPASGVSLRQREMDSERPQSEAHTAPQHIVCTLADGPLPSGRGPAGTCAGHAEQRLLPLDCGGFAETATIPHGLLLPPVRCGISTGGSNSSGEDVRDEVRNASIHGAPGALQVAGVCSHWLERHFLELLGRVVDDALMGGEDAV